MSIFEKATRKNFQFASSVGDLNVIQLWDLPLLSTRGACLNDVAKAINTELKKEDEDSFVTVKRNTKKGELEDKLEVVKRVIEVKMAEEEARKTAADKAIRKAQLIELIAQKDAEEQRGKSKAELLAELESL